MRIRLSLNELLIRSRLCTKIKLGNNIVYTVVRLLLSRGSCIRNGVNGNTAINGGVNETDKGFRSSVLEYQKKKDAARTCA